jgi:hypothetical protein
VFTFIPESCSGSSRNTVRNHPGIAFILSRIPQYSVDFLRNRFFILGSTSLEGFYQGAAGGAQDEPPPVG